jgi:hypothetical protein
LYYLNSSTKKEIVDLDNEISKFDNMIKDLKNKPEVQIYSLIENNKKTIAELEKRSKITDYLRHIRAVSNSYAVKFTGFNLSNGTITTQAVFESGTSTIAYQKARDFVRNYRKDENALLDL